MTHFKDLFIRTKQVVKLVQLPGSHLLVQVSRIWIFERHVLQVFQQLLYCSSTGILSLLLNISVKNSIQFRKRSKIFSLIYFFIQNSKFIVIFFIFFLFLFSFTRLKFRQTSQRIRFTIDHVISMCNKWLSTIF